MNSVIKIDLSNLPPKAKKAVGNMQNAIWAVQRAQEFVKAAIGETDAGFDYQVAFEQMIEELSEDLDAIGSGEVYEFKE